MNAVNPVRKIRPLSSESRIFRRGALGDSVSGRSREGRFLSQLERELITFVGGQPSLTQKLLIRRLARGMLRLELLDEKMTRDGTLTDHDSRTFGGLTNAVRLLSRELGLKAKPVEKAPSLDAILAEHGTAR